MKIPFTTAFFQAQLPLLERYLIAKDKQQYLNTLPNGNEKNLLMLLINPLPENFSQTFKQLNIPVNVQRQLLIVKLMTNVRTSNTQQQQAKYIDTLIKQFHTQISFDYLKPSQNVNISAESNQIQGQQQKESNSRLKLQDNLERYLQSLIEKDQNSFKNFNDYGIKNMKEEFLLGKLSIGNKRHLINNINFLRSFKDQFVVKFLIKYAQQQSILKKTQFYQEIERYTLQKLSLSQINLLKQTRIQITKNSNFTRIWFQLNYFPKIYQQQTRFQKTNTYLSQMNQRRQLLFQIKQQLSQYNYPALQNYLKPYSRQLFYEILILDIKRQDPQLEDFIEFIKYSTEINTLFCNTFVQILTSRYGKGERQDFNMIRCKGLFSSLYDYEKMITQYIQKLFKKHKNHQQLKSQLYDFFDSKFINKLYTIYKLQQHGEQTINIGDILTVSQLEWHKRRKQLTIVEEKTQKCFKSNEDVTLTLRIKNITKIKIKIYEMNLEQFYLESFERNIDEKMNLEYLHANYQQVVEIKRIKNCYQVIEEEIVLDKIKKGCGFYIVELVGQGLTSRAVIRKGAIACIQQNNINGKLLKFYDQQGNTIKNLKIWRSGRELTIQNGQYLIPFNKNGEQKVQIIAVKDNFAQKFQFTSQRQIYSFNFGAIYNHESFIVGKKARIILHPVLRLNSEQTSIQNMKNIKISTILTNSQNIKSNIKFCNIKFSSNNDYILQIPLKSYTKDIDITVQGQVMDLNGKIINLSWRRVIYIELMQEGMNFIDLYLERADGGKVNVLKLRGLNGEEITNVQVGLEIQTLGTSEIIKQSLRTNKNRQINLGELQFATSVKASFMTSQARIQRTWNLGVRAQQQQLSILDQQLIYAQGDSITIPSTFNQQLPNNPIQLSQQVTFSKILNKYNQTTYQNKLSSIKIQNQNGSVFLQIQNLEPGVYKLCFLKLKKDMRIRVLNGKRWSSGEVYDQITGVVFKVRQSAYKFIAIGDFRQEKGEKPDTKKVTIPINIPQQYKSQINTKQIRIHAILKNYSDSSDPTTKRNFNYKQFTQVSSLKQQQLNSTQSRYYSNKQLSDQQAYVLNRQNQKKFIGNNFEKPKMFLKRIEVRDTSESQQILRKQGDYKQSQFNEESRKCAERSLQCFQGDIDGSYRLHRGRYSPPNEPINYTLNSHNNYLSLSGHTFLNLPYHPTIQLNIPSNYNQLTILLITSQSAIKKTFYLQNNHSQQQKAIKQNYKDMKHRGLQQEKENSGWSMSRQTYLLREGQSKQISRDSVWCTVGLQNILQFAQIKGAKLPDWVKLWITYPQQKKLQVYDKQVCHELNVYISRHDKQFFNNVVQPFIKNKIIKTFVDYYLLRDTKCMNWINSHKIQSLNQFEKVLLIEFLIEKGKQEQAKSIALSMELYQKSIKKGFQQYKVLFDMVLNSQATKSQLKRASKILQRRANLKQQKSKLEQNKQKLELMRRRCSSPRNAMLQDSKISSQSDNQCSQQQSPDEDQLNLDVCQSKPKIRDLSKISLKKGFKQIQKTKQYTQTTYSEMKNPKSSKSLIQPSLFWSHLANHLISQNTTVDFLSQSFIYFTQPIQFTLACCFLPTQKSTDYQMTNQQQKIVIQCKKSFILFVKQVKQLQFVDKFGVLINQRFFDPQQRYSYQDDGTQIEKLVEQFVVKKPYTLQTIITNTSGTNLQLQVLMDIPSGSIPLQSHQNVQIINVTINSFSTTSFQRCFYFPQQGKSTLYPANASRNNIVLAKSRQLPSITIKKSPTINKLQTFTDVMRSGSKRQILQYIQKRNIFDSKVFSPSSILWVLHDKQFFNKVISILKRRKFYDDNVWSFGIFHKDYQCIKEYVQYNNQDQSDLKSLEIPIFQYFPYFSKRVHKFLDQKKSTIRNKQFKQTYDTFLISLIVDSQYTSTQKVAFCYYLLLQDRIEQCSVVFSSFTQEQKQPHQIQTDYLSCYLSMYQDYPNFTIAQKISTLYNNYPIQSWRKMFNEIQSTLKQYKSEDSYEQNVSENKIQEHKTVVIRQGELVRIKIPKQTRVEVYFYDVNLEMYFSDYPFEEVKSLSIVKPKITKTYSCRQNREERILYSQVQSLENMIVEVYQFKQNVPATKIQSFVWQNPKLKVKLIQSQGTLQVFYQKKKQSGCYVKVYSIGTKGTKFYRDGYTDITGKFKYALSDLQGIVAFSILTITPQGGIISKIQPPSTSDYFST